MKKPLIFAALALLCFNVQAYNVKEDLKRLDAVLDKASDYVSAKESRISSLERMLDTPGNGLEQQYGLLEMIYDEYFTYQFDGARHVLARMEEVAERLHSASKKTDIILMRSKLYCVAGMFLEAKNMLDNSLDTLSLNAEQRLLYYDIMQRYSGDYMLFSADGADTRSDLWQIQDRYMDAILSSLPAEDARYRFFSMLKLYSRARYPEALNIASNLAAECKPLDHNYSLYTYYMGAFCSESGNMEDAIHWFVESAIGDICGAVKDNASIFSLAKILIDAGQEERAFRYTQMALEDALFYNAKLRPLQITSALPQIQSAYDQRRNQQDRRAGKLITLVSVMFLLIVCALIYVLNSSRNRQKTGLELREANRAKEEYLGLFLSMCSSYLDKLRKHISMKEMDEELRVFYNTFDNAFLNLYPDFVRDFNSLLREEERIVLKKDEILSTELRIFALIKLGVTQSSHIASLLRYSVNTIYNYRAQVKKAALGDPETFEERVKNL